MCPICRLTLPTRSQRAGRRLIVPEQALAGGGVVVPLPLPAGAVHAMLHDVATFIPHHPVDRVAGVDVNHIPHSHFAVVGEEERELWLAARRLVRQGDESAVVRCRHARHHRSGVDGRHHADRDEALEAIDGEAETARRQLVEAARENLHTHGRDVLRRPPGVGHADATREGGAGGACHRDAGLAVC